MEHGVFEAGAGSARVHSVQKCLVAGSQVHVQLALRLRLETPKECHVHLLGAEGVAEVVAIVALCHAEPVLFAQNGGELHEVVGRLQQVVAKLIFHHEDLDAKLHEVYCEELHQVPPHRVIPAHVVQSDRHVQRLHRRLHDVVFPHHVPEESCGSKLKILSLDDGLGQDGEVDDDGDVGSQGDERTQESLVGAGRVEGKAHLKTGAVQVLYELTAVNTHVLAESNLVK